MILDWKKKKVVSKIERQEEETVGSDLYYIVSDMNLGLQMEKSCGYMIWNRKPVYIRYNIRKKAMETIFMWLRWRLMKMTVKL